MIKRWPQGIYHCTYVLRLTAAAHNVLRLGLVCSCNFHTINGRVTPVKPGFGALCSQLGRSQLAIEYCGMSTDALTDGVYWMDENL